MKPAQRLTAIIEREDDGFVALCPEFSNEMDSPLCASEGSHQIMQKRLGTTTITVPIPLHDPVQRGTLLSIIRSKPGVQENPCQAR